MSDPTAKNIPESRAGCWLDLLALALGAALSAWFIRLVLATGNIHWGLDADLALTISLLLATAGPALLGTPRLVWLKRPRRWTIGEWLWPGTLITNLAWLVVWLEDGSRLGAVAKLVAGPIALLVTPALSLLAATMLPYSLARRGNFGWRHWLGLVWALIGGAGCVTFVRIMLPLRF
jgi:hypothetical protein